MSACLRRWLVVWMLLVAVPLQGIAAVLACGPAHQRIGDRGAQPVGAAQATVAEIAAVRVTASDAAVDAGKAAHAHHGRAHGNSVGGAEGSPCADHGFSHDSDPSGVDDPALVDGHASAIVDDHGSATVDGHALANFDDHASADGSPDGSSSCNGCAPCCTGAALTSGFALPLHAGPGVADFPSLNDGHLSAPLRALERPPRLHV
ncbi:MAG TPA: hypothetical protein PKA20_27225 [Burkholderiaceae bacterium]|nr:hypothetical protein [Burkholderiaceae bacterium]